MPVGIRVSISIARCAQHSLPTRSRVGVPDPDFRGVRQSGSGLRFLSVNFQVTAEPFWSHCRSGCLSRLLFDIVSLCCDIEGGIEGLSLGSFPEYGEETRMKNQGPSATWPFVRRGSRRATKRDALPASVSAIGWATPGLSEGPGSRLAWLRLCNSKHRAPAIDAGHHDRGAGSHQIHGLKEDVFRRWLFPRSCHRAGALQLPAGVVGPAKCDFSESARTEKGFGQFFFPARAHGGGCPCHRGVDCRRPENILNQPLGVFW
jgi:hypothetical protein